MSDEKKTVLSMRHINKTFPGVKALSDAQLTLREGEIHALMGENGAGKSTLIKVLTGVEEFETGEIIMDGKSIINTSPQEAGNNGISTVYQEVNLCRNTFRIDGSRKYLYRKRTNENGEDRLEDDEYTGTEDP